MNGRKLAVFREQERTWPGTPGPEVREGLSEGTCLSNVREHPEKSLEGRPGRSGVNAKVLE